MANQDIVNGLRQALARGESLKQAMITFYNAGYKKEEIEDAAREIQGNQRLQYSSQTQYQQPATFTQQPQYQQPTQPIQKVSSYTSTTGQVEGKKWGSKMVWILGSILVLLVISLSLAFAFKTQLIDFLTKLFG